MAVGFRKVKNATVFFLGLKTIADVIMHGQEHFMRADPPPLRPGGGCQPT